MAYTTADLDALKAQALKIERETQSGQDRVQNRAWQEIRAQISFVENELNRQAGGSRIRTTYASFSKD